MIKVKVKTIWQGKVGIREKYINEALETNSGLMIKVKEETMTLAAEEVKKKIVAKSERPFIDKYSGQSHFLVYYNWKPNGGMASLFG